MKMRNTALLFLVAVVDFLALGVVMAAFAPLFLAKAHGLFSATTSHDARLYYLGLAFAMAPLGQLFSSPVFGSFSDRWGRRKVLLCSLSGTFLAILLTAAAINCQSLVVLLIGRLLVGLFSGNIVVAQSALADITPNPKRKPWRFNFLQLGVGFGMLFGPMLGGKLLNTQSAFGFALPFYCSAFLVLFVLVLVLAAFRETYSPAGTAQQTDYLQGIRRLSYLFTMKPVRLMLLAWVVFMLGWDFYMQYFTNFLLGALHFDPNEIGNFFSYLGITYLLAQLLIVQPATFFLPARKVLLPAAIAVAVFIFSIGFANHASVVCVLISFYIVAIGLFIPNYNALLSDCADERHQGLVFGACISLHAMTTLVMALIGGFLVAISFRLPLWGAGSLMAVACVLFYCFVKRISAESSAIKE